MLVTRFSTCAENQPTECPRGRRKHLDGMGLCVNNDSSLAAQNSLTIDGGIPCSFYGSRAEVSSANEKWTYAFHTQTRGKRWYQATYLQIGCMTGPTFTPSAMSPHEAFNMRDLRTLISIIQGEVQPVA